MQISLVKFKPALTIAILIMILGMLIAIDNPNNRNIVSVIAAIILGYGTILVKTISPVVVIPLLGFIGFVMAITTHNLVRWKRWLEIPIAMSLAIMILLNTLGFIIWTTGHVEGQW